MMFTGPSSTNCEQDRQSRPESTSHANTDGFPPRDPKDPHNWSSTKKIGIVLILLNTVFNSTISSTLPSGNAAAITSAFQFHNNTLLVLLTSIYLLGHVFGPLVFPPLSEVYERRTVLLPTFFCFTSFTLGCALAQNWNASVVLTLLTGLVASAPITIVRGVYADIYELDITQITA